MAELVPLQVILKTGRVDQRGNKTVWPNFSTIPASARGDMDWANFVDFFTVGWQYDKVTNIGKGAESETASTLIPRSFAEAAVALFPADCSITDEATFETFYDTKATVEVPEFTRNVDVLTALKVERDLLVAMGRPTVIIDAEIDKAINPDDPASGVKRNLNKKWANRKLRLGGNTVEPGLALP